MSIGVGLEEGSDQFVEDVSHLAEAVFFLVLHAGVEVGKTDF